MVWSRQRLRLVWTKGTVDFNNPLRIEPFFDVEAETRVRVPNQTYRVTIRVTGTTAQKLRCEGRRSLAINTPVTGEVPFG